MEEKAGTPLDDLYNLLLKKKIMRVEDIASHFKVSKDLVMEWGKILEAGELATISNPRIGKPVIKLISHTGESKEELSEGEIIETKLKTQEDIIQKNKLIRNRNKGKIKEAKKIIFELREKQQDDQFIKNIFIEKRWPEKLIDELLS